MKKITVVDGLTRTYAIDTLYLDGSLLKLAREGDDLVIENDVTAQEAAEFASEFNKPFRIFTGQRRRQLRKK